MLLSSQGLFGSPASCDVGLQPFDESGQRHDTQILTGAGTHGDCFRFQFPVTNDQQIRNAPQGVFTNFKADFLVSQVSRNAETLLHKGFFHLRDITGLMIGDIEHHRLHWRQPSG